MTRRRLLTAALLAIGCGALLPAHAAPAIYKRGAKIADFAFKDEHGKTVHLSQFAGKVIVLNFYASW